MKTLVVYYSRTGTTRKIAELIQEKLSADLEEIEDTIDRKGIVGYFRSGRDAMKKSLTKLEPFKKNLNEYDLVIIGTPIWGWNMSVPIRTFLHEKKGQIKKVAFFCTMGGSGSVKAFEEMWEISGKEPVATLALTNKEIIKNNFQEKINFFLEGIKKAYVQSQ
jgi:flavodoxin